MTDITQRYQKRPVVIEAVQLTTATLHQVIDWVTTHGGQVPWSGINASGVPAISVVNSPAAQPLTNADGGELHAPVGQYLVREQDGSFAVYTSEQFHAVHQPLNSV